MALAATGGPKYVMAMRHLVELRGDGTFDINRDYFSYDKYGPLRPFTAKFHETFGPARLPGEPLTERHRDLAHALQALTEDIVLHLARHARTLTGSRNLVLCGGVGLNCVANARLLEAGIFARLWVPPCASDTGVPLGSTLWHHHQTNGHPREFALTHAYFGLSFSRNDARAALEEAGLDYEELSDAAVLDRVAADLADGRIVGWFQGAFEMGPRALGNRSILASPIRNDVREIINARIKFREPFRPFAPVVLEEFAAEYFEIDQPDPYMTLAPRVREEKKALIPAAVHVDGTARIQTINRAANPRYYDLISAFAKLTGVPVLINTSFNKQEPIVARPREAVSCYLRTDMDVLVMGNLYTRSRSSTAEAQARQSFNLLDVNTHGGE